MDDRRAYRCDRCDVSWPPVKTFEVCPGCGNAAPVKYGARPLTWAAAARRAQELSEVYVISTKLDALSQDELDRMVDDVIDRILAPPADSD